jgi:RHS repeat-associated protein
VTQATNTTESYSYDPVGNRLSSLGVSPYSVNSSNELTAIPSATYTYDNNGNTLTKVTSAGTTTYGWDYENRLTSMTLPGTGGTLGFKYDGIGRRVQKLFTQNSNTSTTNYLYDRNNALADLDQNGNVLARYTATRSIDEPLAELRSGATSYYSQDGLGSVTSLTTSAGAIGNTYRYDSFGNLSASSGSIANRLQYTGREFDIETGLYYSRARYYDPSIGRFLSEDSIRFAGGVNFYSYVANDPVNFFDPLGLAAQPKIEYRWRDCTPGEESFCIARCDAQGFKYMGCRVAQTKRIKSLKHGADWYDYEGEPSCWCEDPNDCPNRLPIPAPSSKQATAAAGAIGGIGLIILIIAFSPVGL